MEGLGRGEGAWLLHGMVQRAPGVSQTREPATRRKWVQ